MKTLVITIIAAIFLASCAHDDEEKDTHLPSMVLNEPKTGDIFKAGDEFHMEMNLSDNQSLKECRVQIFPDSLYDDDGHKSVLHGGAWEVTRTFNLSGTTFHLDEHMDVPDSIDQEPLAHGRYFFRVNCIDASGNEVKEEVKFFLHD